MTDTISAGDTGIETKPDTHSPVAFAHLCPSTPLSPGELAARDELAGRFGIDLGIEAGCVSTIHGDRTGLDAVNAALWSAGEHQGDYLNTRHLAALAARVGLAMLGARHPTTLAALHNHANCLEAAGRLREARAIFEQVLGGRRDALGPDDEATLLTQNDLGLVLLALGEAEQARRLQADTLARRRRLLGQTHRRTLSSMNNLAVALRTLGENGQATRLVRRVLKVRRERYGDEHRDTLMGLNNLAGCLVESGQIDQARSLLARAWRGFARQMGDSHRDTLTALHNLAWCHQTLGEVRTARGLYEQLVERCRHALGDEHPDTLMSERNLARFLSEQGESGPAVLMCERIHQVQRRVLGPHHEDTLKTREMIVAAAVQSCDPGSAQHVDAFIDAVSAAPSYTAAWPGLAASAAAHLAAMPGRLSGNASRRLSDLSQSLLEAYDLAPSDKRHRIASDFMAFHRSWLAVCVRSRVATIPEALSAIHGREINALLLGNWSAQVEALGQDDPRRRFLDIRRRIIDLRVQIEWLADPDEGAKLKTRHDRYIAEYRRIRERLTRNHPDFYSAEAPVIQGETLRARLQPGECALLLFSLPPAAGQVAPSYVAACLSAAKISVVELNGLDQCVDRFRRSEVWADGEAAVALRRVVGAEAPPDSDGQQPLDLKRWSRAVADALWRTVDGVLPAGTDTVFLVTHDALHPLPLEHGRPEGMRVFVCPGVVFLAHRLASRRNRQLADEPTGQAQDSGELPSLAVHTDTGASVLGIPFAHADAVALDRLWREAGAAPPSVTQGAATAPRWRAGAPGFDIWHFACHGREVSRPVRQTVLALGGATTLDANMVLASGQHPRLVVLGACVVGRVKDSPTGEPLGLISGLWLAGAEYIVAPVQPVPDFWMPLITVLFYQSLLDGMDPAQALDQAKKRLRSGQWQPGVADVIAVAYRKAIAEWLPAACADEGLAGVLSGWYLPPDLAARLRSVGAGKLVAEVAAEDPSGAAFGHRIASHLSQSRRRLPAAVVDHLTLWLRGFGMPRSAGCDRSCR